ncbi:MAG: HPP family protein [Labedaea sp.]
MRTTAAKSVRAVMTDRVLAVTVTTTPEVALRLMTESGIRHLPVMDGERCVGLAHECDLLWTLWTHGLTGRTVGACCRTPVPVVHPDDPATVAAARMSDGGCDAVLVTAGGAIVGIVTAADLVGHLAALTED